MGKVDRFTAAYNTRPKGIMTRGDWAVFYLFLFCLLALPPFIIIMKLYVGKIMSVGSHESYPHHTVSLLGCQCKQAVHRDFLFSCARSWRVCVVVVTNLTIFLFHFGRGPATVIMYKESSCLSLPSYHQSQRLHHRRCLVCVCCCPRCYGLRGLPKRGVSM